MSETHLHCSSIQFQQQQQQQQQQQRQWMVSAAAAESLHDQELRRSRCLSYLKVLGMTWQCLAGSQTSLPNNMPEQYMQTCVQHLPTSHGKEDVCNMLTGVLAMPLPSDV